MFEITPEGASRLHDEGAHYITCGFDFSFVVKKESAANSHSCTSRGRSESGENETVISEVLDEDVENSNKIKKFV